MMEKQRGFVPSLEWLASRPMTHTADETFAAPMITNWWAEAQACKDPLAYRLFSAPPFATAEGWQAEFYLRLPHLDQFLPLHKLEAPITFTWYPDRVVRSMAFDGLRFESTMRLAAGRPILLIDFTITNTAHTARSGLHTHLKLLSGVQRLDDVSTWHTVAPPAAATRADTERNAFVFAGDGPVYSVQGVNRVPLSFRSSRAYAEWLGDANMFGIVSDRVNSPSTVAGLEYELNLAAGETWRLQYVHALAGSESEALSAYDDAQANFSRSMNAAKEAWRNEINAAFTPGSDRFSGVLPTLAGVHEAIQRVYYTGAVNLLFMKRTGPRNKFGTTYKTISPRSGATFWLWDTQQAARGLVHLDPETLRTMAEWWMQSDIHAGWGTDYLTGNVLGTWYSVNDYALFTVIHEYLRYSGDYSWLDTEVGDRTVLEHLRRCATHWQDLDTRDYLVDYGETDNLLECVKTYTHEVAALNAANAWMNRRLVAIERWRGNTQAANRYAADAKAITDAVLHLYRPGGYFTCRQPDGSYVGVQHCYDFGVVMDSLFEELGERRRREMLAFFKNKLQTPSWMRALAADDPAATLNLRTDHTATGAYTSWPVYALLALCRAGDLENALWWLGVDNPSGGIAGVAAQGPYGQGTFHGGKGSLLEHGAGRKAPDDPPHYEEWIDVAGGAFIGAIIEGLFGVEATLFDGVSASDALLTHQPDARLFGLRHHDGIYDYVAGALRRRS